MMKAGNGRTLGIDEVEKYVIGVKELEEDPDRMLPAGRAMLPVLTLFHEVAGHGGQIRYEYHQTGSLQMALALNYYACKGSIEYYEGNGTESSRNYWLQPHEIAAQYMGVKSCREYLTKTCEGWLPDMVGMVGWDKSADVRKQIDAILLDCVNYRVRKRSEFVCKLFGYKSVDEVLSSLDKQFYSRIEAHRPYDKTHGQAINDSLCEYAKINNFVSGEMVESCSNGVWQDLMMAYAFGGYWYSDEAKINRYIPVFRQFNCSPSGIFIDFDRYMSGEMSFALTTSESENGVTEVMKELEKKAVEQNVEAVPIGKSCDQMTLMRLKDTLADTKWNIMWSGSDRKGSS